MDVPRGRCRRRRAGTRCSRGTRSSSQSSTGSNARRAAPRRTTRRRRDTRCPSAAATKPSMRIASPKPPASTTPFSLSTGSSSGVRWTESNAAAATRLERLLECRAASAAAARRLGRASLSTVSIVPSTGLRTAWKATVAERSSAVREQLRCRRVSAPSMPSHRPRRIWLRMTPELPRAPMSEPCVTAWQTSASVGVGGELRRPRATTASIVSDMLVPVSPSGTGKTLSRLTSSLRSFRAAAAEAIEVASGWACVAPGHFACADLDALTWTSTRATGTSAVCVST